MHPDDLARDVGLPKDEFLRRLTHHRQLAWAELSCEGDAPCKAAHAARLAASERDLWFLITEALERATRLGGSRAASDPHP